ncbi:hypothetical protein QYE76_038570 [Lolium multiflorum]|uniref:F-box domain-containing protein n=1 Tax=Lolium multiflorum TaxID=4521 RepID=A0AAD8T9E4_LOLMU|nr:hypothetical protein QYE76_038570 [Lolium multiflorum]
MVYIPMELVLEILVRLPWTSLRRLRLVCRTWRDLVHDRTTEMKQRRDAVPLIVTTESVYVLDGQGSSNSKAITPREHRNPTKPCMWTYDMCQSVVQGLTLQK